MSPAVTVVTSSVICDGTSTVGCSYPHIHCLQYRARKTYKNLFAHQLYGYRQLTQFLELGPRGHVCRPCVQQCKLHLPCRWTLGNPSPCLGREPSFQSFNVCDTARPNVILVLRRTRTNEQEDSGVVLCPWGPPSCARSEWRTPDGASRRQQS